MSELEDEIAEAMGDDEVSEQDVDAPDEPEQGDEPETDEPETDEPEAAAPQNVGPTDDVVWEQRFKKAESAFKTYSNRITAIWEEEAVNLVPFGLSPSAPPGFIDPRDAGRVDEATKRTILEFVGIASEIEYLADGDVRTCTRCDGLGKTRTGSKVPGNETRKCLTCLGYGFTPPPGPSQNGAAQLDTQLSPIADDFSPFPAEEVDAWGEPRILPDGRENPNFGKMPQFKIQVQPWGTTAGLTAQDVTA